MKNLLYTSLACLLLLGCRNENLSDNADNTHKRTSIIGNIVYGGVLNVSEEESFNSIFPGEIVDAISAKICTQIHDGLVKFNPKDLSIRSAIAKDW